MRPHTAERSRREWCTFASGMSGHARSAACETTQQCTRAGTHAGRELRTLAIVAAASALAAMIMTLPLWQHPTRRLPSDLVDTLLNTWIIGWDADRLRHGLQGVWQAPIFHPYDNTLAFSENLLGIAVLVAPVY